MADNTREITTVFKADISNFSAATQQLNRNVANINSEFKNATASMGKWNDNTDGLNAKLKQLNGVLDQEKQRLKMLNDQYDELVKQGKANTKEAQQLATAINNQSAKVKETKKNIDYYTDSLKELEDAGVDSKKALEDLNKKNEDLKKNAKELGGGILKGAAVGIAGIAAACVGALKGMGSLVEETKELRTQMGQLETTFNETNLGTKAAEQTFNDLYGVLGDSGKATEAALHLGNIAKSEKELNEMTNYLTGVYAKFGDSLPLEGLSEAISHTAKLGGSVQGNLADALEWAGINTDDFNEKLSTLNTEEERAQLINSTLSELYGETGKQYKEVNKDVIAANEAQNQYNQSMADLAEKVQPAMTQFKLAMVNVVQTVFDKLSEADLEGFITKISNAITTVVNVALPPLMSALTWVLDNLNWLAPLLATIGGSIGAISAAIKIYNTVMKIAKVVQIAWNIALSANPIGIIIIAIGALVAAFVLLWNKCEGFRNFFINMWDAIKKAATTTMEFLGKVFGGIIDLYKNYINGIIKGINGAISLLNKIKIPDWEIFGEYAGKGINIPTVPLLAKGGIVDKPTLAMVGEAGKEAVMPLENNTGWIDKLADKLGSKMGTNTSTVNNFNYTFEKMETSRLALHKAQLETKRILGGNK